MMDGSNITHPLIRLPEAHAEATKIRLKLLEMGYRPLPTASKVAFQKGWPLMPVDRKAIESWPMSVTRDGEIAPAVTTAIQLTGNMLAIDVDVNDFNVTEKIEDIIADVVGEDVFGAMPMRTSGSAKFMLLCRTDKPVGMLKTRKYRDHAGSDHMVEFYGGKSTRYFSCFGPHTIGKVVNGRREVIKAYEWVDGPSPLTVRPEDLPLISQEQFDAIFDKVAILLRDMAPKMSWEEVKNSISGEFEGGVVYDLTPEMTFDVHGWGPVTYEQALGIADHYDNARCSSSFIDGSSINTQKCDMSVIETGDEPYLAVFDYETWQYHLPASQSPEVKGAERAEKLEKIGASLRELMPEEVAKVLREAEEAGVATELFKQTIEHLLENVAFDNKTGMVHYLDKGSETMFLHVNKTTLKGVHVRADLQWTGAKGGKHTYSPVDAWFKDPHRLDVDGVRFNPATSDRVYEEAGQTFANAFCGSCQRNFS
jgi:hypothetical protein